MSCSDRDITVSDWYSHGCVSQAPSFDAAFYTNLFKSFYPRDEIWVPEINNPTKEQLEFQYMLIDICNNAGKGYCRSPLFRVCSGYTRSDMINPTIRSVCGCYLPSSQYNVSVERQCDPVCTGYNSISYFGAETAKVPTSCSGDICLISDITVESMGSGIGEIKFSQICPFCGVDKCRCIIADIDIISRDSRLRGVDISTNCSSSLCFDTTTSTNSVPCGDYVKKFGLDSNYISQMNGIYVTYIVGLVILFIVVVVLLFLEIGI
jgi:hypothetical protein